MAKITRLSITGSANIGSIVGPLNPIFPSTAPFVAWQNLNLIIEITVNPAVVVNMVRIKNATSPTPTVINVNLLNSGNPLVANSEYDFEVPVAFGEGINLVPLAGTTLVNFDAFVVEEP
jgi:hypothetical protein